MTECLIPNSFQVPNVFIDELAALLDAEEWLIVSYLCRRTFGFQKRQDRISLSQFAEGTRARDGRVLDHGTGLGKSIVRDRLAALKRYGVIRATAPNNAENHGTEYALELELAKIDFPGLIERRAHEMEARRRRTEPARTARGAAPPPPAKPEPPAFGEGTPGDDGGVDLQQGVRVEAQQGGGIDPQHAGGGVPQHAPVPAPNTGACWPPTPHEPRETQGNPGEGGWAHDPAVLDLYREMAPAEPARRLLGEIGIAGPSLTFLTETPLRCYWAVFWATMWPAVAHRIASAGPFIRARVDGACAGKVEDREPPRDWWPYQERQAKARRQEALALAARERDRAKFRRAPLRFGAGAEALWLTFHNAQREEDQAFLAGAVAAELRDGELRVALESETAVERLARRKSRLLEVAREVAPSFPEVSFVKA